MAFRVHASWEPKKDLETRRVLATIAQLAQQEPQLALFEMSTLQNTALFAIGASEPCAC